MRKYPLIPVLLCAALAAPAFAAGTAPASAPGKAPTTQQQRMKSCNAEAKSKSLKGGERKSFMSSCLKGNASASAERTEQTARQ